MSYILKEEIMTKQAKKVPVKKGKVTSEPLAELSGLNGDMFEQYVQVSQSLFENAYALNEEMMRFAGRRFEADMEALQTLSKCKDSDDIVRFQSDFMRTAAEDYRQEMAKLIEQGSEAMKTFSEGSALR